MEVQLPQAWVPAPTPARRGFSAPIVSLTPEEMDKEWEGMNQVTLTPAKQRDTTPSPVKSDEDETEPPLTKEQEMQVQLPQAWVPAPTPACSGFSAPILSLMQEEMDKEWEGMTHVPTPAKKRDTRPSSVESSGDETESQLERQ